jgi:hypothetical protein
MAANWGSDVYQLVRIGTAAAIVGERAVHICTGTDEEVADFFEHGGLTASAGRLNRGKGSDLLRVLREALRIARAAGWDFLDGEPCHPDHIAPYRKIAARFGATEYTDEFGDVGFRLFL